MGVNGQAYKKSGAEVGSGYFLFDEDFLRGTLPPALRASDSPIAIACFLLVTFLPERPLLSVPFLRSCIAFSTFSPAFFPYLAIAVIPPSNSRAGRNRYGQTNHHFDPSSYFLVPKC